MPQTGQVPAGQIPATPQTVHSGLLLVEIKGFSFVGETSNITAGTKVTWKNYDDTSHTVTSDTGLFISKILKKGDTFSYVFNQKGTFKYHCSIHPFMTGQVMVQ